jgi:hypothetical protein
VRGNFTVDVGVDFGLIARCVKALVALHVRKQAGVVAAAAGASNASSGGWVEGGVFLVEWGLSKGEVEIGLYPRAKVLGGE